MGPPWRLQLYQLHVSIVVDAVGQRAQQLSTRGSLRLMEFVRKYTVRLRPVSDVFWAVFCMHWLHWGGAWAASWASLGAGPHEAAPLSVTACTGCCMR